MGCEGARTQWRLGGWRAGCRWFWISAIPLLALAVGSTQAVGADRVTEIAEIHVAALGGRERIAALHAYRSVGRLRVGDVTALLTVTAARPNKLRVETTYPDHATLVVFDGARAVQRDDDRAPELLVGTAAEALADAADFDDALIAPEQCGCTVDFAGEAALEGAPVFRLLVTRKLTQSYFLAVDEDTYFILARVENAADQSRTRTRYGDYRPVAGVLLPHRVSVEVSGQPPRVAVFDRIEPNPALSPETFRLR